MPSMDQPAHNEPRKHPLRELAGYVDSVLAEMARNRDVRADERGEPIHRVVQVEPQPSSLVLRLAVDLSAIGLPTNSQITVVSERGRSELAWYFEDVLIARTPKDAPPAEAARALDMEALLAAFRRAMAPDPESLELADFEFISVYTRSQAIEDGVLIDVSETAREAGLRYPTALTAAVYEQYVKVPEGVVAQDEAGRLWDVLWMCRFGINRATSGSTEVLFQLHVRNDNRAGTPPLVTLKAVCGPGDDGRPCLTILLPEES